MKNCARALDLVDEMLALTKQAAGRGEQGFVGCATPQGKLVVGARCADSGNHCTVKGPVCPGGGEAKLSFHTHSSGPSVMDFLTGINPFVGDAAKVALLPSVKDIVADEELHVDVGCVGGPLNDGTSLLWCFWRNGSAEPPEPGAQSLKDRVGEFQEKVKTRLKIQEQMGGAFPLTGMAPHHTPQALRADLLKYVDEYLTTISAPCIEVRLPLEQAGGTTSECPLCAVIAAVA